MLHKFEYDGIVLRGIAYFIKGEADITFIEDECTSEMGNQWVVERLRSHKVNEVYIEHMEEIESEVVHHIYPPYAYEYISDRIEDEPIEFSRE